MVWSTVQLFHRIPNQIPLIMTHSAVIRIENHSGIWYVNHKRLGHDKLSDLEVSALNEFIKEYKQSNQ